MASILALMLTLHAAALAAVLLMARHSVMLVDEDGRPIRPSAWRERVVPPREAPAPTGLES